MATVMTGKQQPFDICVMMERLGIEPGGAVVARWGLSYTAALHRCQSCGRKPTCHDWLISAALEVSLAPDFCPNADILLEMQFDQPIVRGAAARH